MKNNAKHTPGPWRVQTSHPSRVAAGAQLDVVRAMSETVWLDEQGKAVRRVIPKTEREANARLIAAAPELYQRLNKRVEDCPCVGDQDFSNQHRCEDCKADLEAIAKANGGML